MLTQFSRTELLLGKEAMERLKGARVAVFGVGGVGGYVCADQDRFPVWKHVLKYALHPLVPFCPQSF